MRIQMDNYNVKKKLHILYICCVLIPLIVTDSVILDIVVRSSQASLKHDMENIASAVKYSLSASVENAATTAQNIYMNKYINQFLDEEYDSALDYFVSCQEFMKDTLFESSISTSSTIVTMYADNDTIVNGGNFSRLASVKDSKWYQYLKDSGQDTVLFIYYDDSQAPAVEARRRVSFIRKLNYYQRDGCEKVLKLDIDYSSIVRSLVNMKYDMPIYVCLNDITLFSNDGNSNVGSDFELFQRQKEVGFEQTLNTYGQTLDIYVLSPDVTITQQILKNIPLILMLIAVNGLLPWLLMRSINRSFTRRLQELSETFDGVEEEKLKEIPHVRGTDEIGNLMRNYNRMAVRTNELIQTVYKDKLKEQEMEIARHNAELLALHSQINPHFLFNALESIRMHSVLKTEYETAHMVEKLAIMQRQNVDWGTDLVTVKQEQKFLEAYLELQKYRFGERLSYQLNVEEDCQDYCIPKLTLVTFVENACVHGIESKPTKGWIFVRIYRKQEWLYLEVEDTGGGMNEEYAAALRSRMNHASIENLKDMGRVGIVNACLRLKMVTNDLVQFELDSEEGAGTLILIRIPLLCLE